MAVSKQDVLSYIAEHITAKRKTVPRKDILAHFGDEAAAVIDELKKAGTIAGKRGRTGGLTLADSAPVADETPQLVEAVPASEVAEATDDTAAEFAALLAQLGDNEQETMSEAAI